MMKFASYSRYVDIVSPLLVQILFRYLNAQIKSLCQDTHDYSQFTQLFLAGAIACNMNSCLMLLSHLIPKKYALNDSSFRVMVNAFIINVLGIAFCAVEINQHSVCKDRFGVVTVSSRITSLLVTLPLAIWTTLLSDTFQPNEYDKHALVCFLFNLFIYSLNLIVDDDSYYWICDASVGFFTVCSIILMGSSLHKPPVLCGESREGKFFNENSTRECETIFSMQRKFIIITVTAVIAFVMVYLFSVMSIIGPDQTLSFNIVVDICFRLAFTITALDVHVTLFRNIEAELLSEKKSHSRRKAFMKYIFHEMRIPLNSLSMAIDILRGMEPHSKISKMNDLLNTMECSASFMEHALNSYITVQQIEERNFELSKCTIKLGVFFEDAIGKLSRTLKEKHGIHVVTVVPDSFPSEIIGDVKQLRYILNNVTMHAARLTADHLRIEVIGGYCDFRGGRKFEISVCIVGNGKRITDIEKELFFSPYGMLFTGRIEKDCVEGLSLLISKEIIKLYGGLFTVFSRDEGTAYSFQIPFDIPSITQEPVKEKEKEISSQQDILQMMSGLTSAIQSSSDNTSNIDNDGDSRRLGHGIDTPVNSFRLGNGSLYFQPRSDGSRCNSMVFDLNEMADTTSVHSPGSLSTSAKDPMSSASHDSCADVEHEYGFYDMDIATADSFDNDESTDLFSDNIASVHTGVKSNTSLSTSPISESGISKPPCRLEEKLKQLEETGAAVSNLKVLVVDDTPCNLKMLQWLLLLNAVKSTSAVNGFEAIQEFEKAAPRFDLIFLDNTMPVMSGLEAVRYMRGRGFSGVIVAVTGNAMPDEINTFLVKGADLVVTKPMKMKKLKMILDCFSPYVSVTAMSESENIMVRKQIHDLALEDI